jgi:hypothetical protein
MIRRAALLGSPVWFVTALLVRLPAVWFHDFWHADGLAFLYLGAGLLHGHFVDLGEGLRVTLPGPTLPLGAAALLPAAMQSPAIFLLQILLCAAWVFPVGALARRRFGDGAAAWAMGLTALLHPLIAPAGMVQAEPFYILVLFSALAASESVRKSLRRWALLLWPLAALSRAEGPLIVLGTLMIVAMHAHRLGDKARRSLALAAASVTLLAVGSYALFYRLHTGDALHASYLKAAMVIEVAPPSAGPDSEMNSLMAGGIGDFFSRSLHRLPGLVAGDLRWWWLGALPGALALLYPALLWGLGSRLRALWAARRRLFAEMDGLDGLILLNLLVFHLVWRAHHHVPMVLVPLLPLTAAALARGWRRFPRLLITAVLLSVAWSGYHVADRYAKAKPENFQPACQLGQKLGAPAMSNDIVGLECAGRDTWLGKREMPFLFRQVTPKDWEEFHQRFPAVRFAIHNPGIRNAARPPENWPQIECLPGRNELEPPVCAYRVPEA